MTLKKIFILLIICILPHFIYAQEFLLLDNYKRKRVKIEVGESLIFKVKGDKKRYSDVILDVEDSLIYLQKHRIALNINQIEKIYFYRKGLIYLAKGNQSLGVGFMLSGLVNPLLSSVGYSGAEHLVMGTSLILLGQLLKIFKHRKYKVGHRYRLRAMNLSFSE